MRRRENFGWRLINGGRNFCIRARCRRTGGGAGFVCGIGVVGIYCGRGGGRASAGGRDGFFLARRAWRTGGAAENEAGELSPGRLAMRAVLAANEKFSVEYGGGGDADVCGRRAGAVGEASDSGAGCDYGAGASLVGAIAAGGVQDAGL